MTEARILPPSPIESLDDYVAAGGGAALERARGLGAQGVIDEIARSGLGGRGGAGFPAGRKWEAVARNHSELEPATVVVNAAEGEPGSFKDRAIIRANPFAIVEGALVATRRGRRRSTDHRDQANVHERDRTCCAPPIDDDRERRMGGRRRR